MTTEDSYGVMQHRRAFHAKRQDDVTDILVSARKRVKRFSAMDSRLVRMPPAFRLFHKRIRNL